MGIFSQPLKKTQVKKTTQPTGGGLFSTPISTTVQQTAIEEALQQPEIKESVARLRETVEEPKKIYTGGAISDIFDTLNIFQYGVVGMLKGKGFSEGVRTRQSWSDKDALGDFGIPGMIGGTLLDIAVDPMTYLSPLSILKKIPGVAAGVEAAGTAFKASKIGKELGERFIYGFGKDPVYMKLAERMFNSKAIGERNILQALRGIIDLPIDKASKLLTRDETLHFIRKPLKEIQKFLSPDEFSMIKKAYNQLDTLSSQWSKLNPGVAETIDQNIGKYIKNAFEEFELPQRTGVFDWMKTKIGVQKARKALPMAAREALGEIANVPYLLGKSMIDLTSDIETTRLFNDVARKFSSDVALEGFQQLSRGQRFFTTALGEKRALFSGIKKINNKLVPILKELKRTGKIDKKLVKLIDNTLGSIGDVRKIQLDEFTKFFLEGEKATRVISKTRRIGALPDVLLGVAEDVKKFTKFKDFIKSDVGLNVEKMFREGILERTGFSSVESFFKYVKEPFKEAVTKITDVVLTGDAKKLVKLQKFIENLTEKATKLKGIDKASVDDALNLLNKTISAFKGEKVEALRKIGNLEMSELAGKFVPEPIFKDLTEMVRAKSVTEKALNKVVGTWKFGKVILNPAGHARNVVSNFLLNSWEGLSPHRLDIYAEGAKEMSKLKKGLPTKWIKEILPLGFDTNTFAFNELKELLGEKGNEHLLRKFGKGFRGIGQKFIDMYGGSESWAKVSQYIFQRKKGLDIQEAWNIAERATFNYSQVTPFIRRLRSSMFGFPFITFTAKATPQAIKTALTHPGRISWIGKVKNAIENQADLKELTRERASQPPWIRDGFYVKLPMKDEHGRSAYFDLTYILPFGDLMSGQFLQRQTIKETGLPEGVPSALVRKSPFINLVRELATNKDFYNDKIWKDSDTQHEQLGDIMRHLMKFGLPPAVADTIPGGYDKSGERRPSSIQSILGTKDYKDTQQRTPMQELLRLGGVKISPVNLKVQDEIKDYYDNKAMETLLKEAGIMKDFTKAYIPKQ